MKVIELIKILNCLDESSNIYLSCDAEGNSYSTLDDESMYRDVGSKGKEFVVLYPYEEGLDYDDLN